MGESLNGEEEAAKITTTVPPSGSTTTTTTTTCTTRRLPRARRSTSIQDDRTSPGREGQGITKQKSTDEQSANREIEVATDATQTPPLQGSEANKVPPKADEDPPKPPDKEVTKEVGPLTEKKKVECEKKKKKKS